MNETLPLTLAQNIAAIAQEAHDAIKTEPAKTAQFVRTARQKLAEDVQRIEKLSNDRDKKAHTDLAGYTEGFLRLAESFASSGRYEPLLGSAFDHLQRLSQST